MQNKTLLALAVIILGAYMMVPWGDSSLKAVALGALAGLLGGHLNGSQSATPATPPVATT